MLSLTALVFAVYWPTLDNGFIWDDETYVENNPTLQSATGLYQIWFKLGAVPQYYPLVHSTFWIEHHLWGLNPQGYHLVNLLLHAASAGLLWRLLAALRVPGAWLAAAIFAVHPVQVETVAWVTERKNALSCLLALASIWTYLKFSPPEPENPAQERSAASRWWLFGLALLLYVLALLSKTVTASVPAVLLVVYWWKRARFDWREAARLAPFFAIGLALASVTVWMEQTRVGAVGEEWDFSPLERVLIAGRALWFYAAKLAWPHPLIFFYPRWTIDGSQWWQYLYPALALALLIGLWLLRARIGRGPLAAALIFAGVLVPALGFFNVYPFRFSFVADHFQYHASIALMALAAAAIALAALKLERPWAMPAAAVLVLAPLGVVAHERTYVYRGLGSLYEDTIAKNPTSWTSHHNLGYHLENQGAYPEAIFHFREAVRIDPAQPRLRISLGRALFLARQLDAAAAQLSEGLARNPDAYDRSYALMHLGNVRTAQKRFDEAFAAYQGALSAKPDNWTAEYSYAVALTESGDIEAGIKKMRDVVRLNPDYPEAQNSLGKMLSSAARPSEAVAPFEKAVLLSPSKVAFRCDLAAALFQMGAFEQAEKELRTAIKLDGRNAEAHYLLGAVLGNRNDLAGAIAEFQLALRIDPNHAGARGNLERATQALQRSGP